MKNKNRLSRFNALFMSAAAGLTALLAPPAGAVDAILSVDSYVSASQPATNFGNAETLPVGNGNRALLRFDLGSILPAGTASDQVAKAVLNVWVNGATKSGSVEVSELLGSWTEPGVTGATLPSVGPAFATKAVSTAGRWVPIVVTSQVKKWLSTPSANNGLLIAPAASGTGTSNVVVALDSKENTASSHAARLEIVLTGTLGGSYTLIVGKTANDSTGRTQLSVPDFITITAALNKIPNNLYSNGVCSARYLIRVLPGVYNERVAMKPCVDLEGSGELTTKITAAGGATYDATSATVIGASEAELRFLTVENTGGAANAIGIFNDHVSPRLTHVTATALGGSAYNFGVDNHGASPMMTNVTATGLGAANSSNVGVQNINTSSPTMANVTATASGGTLSAGVWNYNNSSPMIMMNVTATASNGTTNYGVYNNGSSPTMTNVTATGSVGYSTYGVYNFSSSPIMENVTATGWGSTSGGMIPLNYGAFNSSSSPRIHRSTLSGSFALTGYNNSTVRVGASQISGLLDRDVGSTITCGASYDYNFTTIASC